MSSVVLSIPMPSGHPEEGASCIRTGELEWERSLLPGAPLRGLPRGLIPPGSEEWLMSRRLFPWAPAAYPDWLPQTVNYWNLRGTERRLLHVVQKTRRRRETERGRLQPPPKLCKILWWLCLSVGNSLSVSSPWHWCRLRAVNLRIRFSLVHSACIVFTLLKVGDWLISVWVKQTEQFAAAV